MINGEAPLTFRPATVSERAGQRCSRWVFRFSARAFTLLEVMIAIAFIGIAMLALLSLHHSGMQSVARARDLSQAAMLAEGLMTDAEQARFPDPGQVSGDFGRLYPGQFASFRWQRIVAHSQEFPDVCRVRIIVFYGPAFRHRFVLTEFMHNPLPQLPSSGREPGNNNRKGSGRGNEAPGMGSVG